jgi:hypothetical protein
MRRSKRLQKPQDSSSSSINEAKSQKKQATNAELNYAVYEKLFNAPYTQNYYSDQQLNLPKAEAIRDMLNSSLLGKYKIVEKPDELVIKPSKCNHYLKFNELFYQCECGKNNSVIQWLET